MIRTIPTVIIGAQWGDEGKGKIVDYLAQKAEIVLRFNGGNNAGHTVVLNGEKFPLSLLPSGVLSRKKLYLSQGVVINPKILLEEIEFFSKKDMPPKLFIDYRVNIVMPYHQWLDQATEEAKGTKKVGSLKLGIGYCYEDRNNRHGIRLEDLINPVRFREILDHEYPEKCKRLEGVFAFKPPRTKNDIYEEYINYGKRLKKYAVDISKLVSCEIKSKNILLEGAHGTFLDANFGTYPYTTAVSTISGAVFSYVGFPPQRLNVIGVVKAYTTRVGGGPMPSELFNEVGNTIQEVGHEFGTVSKRRRRCGWLDLPMLRLSHRLNGFSSLAITKIDVLSSLSSLKIITAYKLKGKTIDEIPSSVSDLGKLTPIFQEFDGWSVDITKIKKYNDLPAKCRRYLEFIEKDLKVPIKYISVAPERSSIIIRK